MIRAALAGNPNTGKTSLFNLLTGSYEYVGNWAGVTVEKKVGILRNRMGTLTDLPGIYSVSPLTKDEGVATRYLVHEPCDCLINIVDASQLERNLYLTVQLLESNVPMVMGLNMIDVARGRGIAVDESKLQDLLHIPVVPIIARKGTGCTQLAGVLEDSARQPRPSLVLDYGDVVEQALADMEPYLPDLDNVSRRWLGLQLLEHNPVVWEYMQQSEHAAQLRKMVERTEQAILMHNHVKNLTIYLRQVRQQFIASIVEQVVQTRDPDRATFSEKLDRVLTHKVWGVPLFLLFMFLTLKLTFDWVGGPLSDWLDGFLAGALTDAVLAGLQSLEASDFIQAVILDGIIAGVGGVLVFFPQIIVLFWIISFIEDSGYMARVTMVMDKLMEAVGLNGKAFIPMIIGFGCNVPGIMAARTIEQPKERLLTILLLPFMSCSARLPVYALFAAAFFDNHQALVVLSLYVLGIAAALLTSRVFSKTLLKQEESMFIVELPPYRIPQVRALARNTWEKGKGFIAKAGTLIFGGSVAIWFLSYAGPSGLNVEMDQSFLAHVGRVIAPVLAPLGFGTWEAGSSLLVGFLAKEVVVSTMNIIHNVPEQALSGVLAGQFTPWQAYAFLVFVLLYVPCLATVGVIRKETMSAKWTLLSVGTSLSVAYLFTLLIYQVGRLFGL